MGGWFTNKEDYDLDELGATGESDVVREKRERREAQWRRMFNVTVIPGRVRKYEFERLHEAAALIARDCLREKVTLPARPDDASQPWLEINAGGRLPPVCCAFLNCRWHTRDRPAKPADTRKHQEHPWDYELRRHVAISFLLLIRLLPEQK